MINIASTIIQNVRFLPDSYVPGNVKIAERIQSFDQNVPTSKL
jgi:hypothetical protein